MMHGVAAGLSDIICQFKKKPTLKRKKLNVDVEKYILEPLTGCRVICLCKHRNI
jgi:hypothetical protein